MRGAKSTDEFPDGRACFKELVSDVNLFAVMFNLSAEIIYCNGHFILMTGLAVDEVMGRAWNEIFVSPETTDSPSPFLDWARNKQDTSHQESALLTQSGEHHWVRWNSIPLRDPWGTIVGVASIGEDTTERRRLERALLDSSARERRQLEGELHDGLGQELFGLALSARALAETAKRGNASLADDLDNLATGLNHANDTCRRISRGFSPLSEVRGGLIQALRNLTATPTNWSGPALAFSLAQGAPLKLPIETLDHIYRLAQEGLTNALRHADASLIRVRLDIQQTTVTLEILDDGVGLQEAASSTGMGLKLMRYRANVLGGHVRVAPAPTRGTHLTFRIEQ
jgi:PAS domain S-box-containing protein